MLSILLMLAAGASAARFESIENSNTPWVDQECHCYDKPWHQQPAGCCFKGLVCNRETWRCVRGVQYRCEKNDECKSSSSTYQRDMICGPANPHGNRECCVESYDGSLDNISLLPWRNPLTAGYAKSCCSQKIKTLMIAGISGQGDQLLEYCA